MPSLRLVTWRSSDVPNPLARHRTDPSMSTSQLDRSSRIALMRICAAATDAELAAAEARLAPLPEMSEIRPPEIGLTMLRGRIGGGGAPFNFGEATVTRAAVRLPSGEVGVSYLLGRRPAAARTAARIDALGQLDRCGAAIDQALVQPVSQRLEREQLRDRSETAATRVDFFTLVRGEDPV